MLNDTLNFAEYFLFTNFSSVIENVSIIGLITLGLIKFIFWTSSDRTILDINKLKAETKALSITISFLKLAVNGSFISIFLTS